mgnify:CR=1 FL=1
MNIPVPVRCRIVCIAACLIAAAVQENLRSDRREAQHHARRAGAFIPVGDQTVIVPRRNIVDIEVFFRSICHRIDREHSRNVLALLELIPCQRSGGIVAVLRGRRRFSDDQFATGIERNVIADHDRTRAEQVARIALCRIRNGNGDALAFRRIARRIRRRIGHRIVARGQIEAHALRSIRRNVVRCRAIRLRNRNAQRRRRDVCIRRRICNGRRREQNALCGRRGDRIRRGKRNDGSLGIRLHGDLELFRIGKPRARILCSVDHLAFRYIGGNGERAGRRRRLFRHRRTGVSVAPCCRHPYPDRDRRAVGSVRRRSRRQVDGLSYIGGIRYFVFGSHRDDGCVAARLLGIAAACQYRKSHCQHQ